MTFDLSIIFDIPECQYFAALRCHVAFAFKIRNHRALRCKQHCVASKANVAFAFKIRNHRALRCFLYLSICPAAGQIAFETFFCYLSGRRTNSLKWSEMLFVRLLINKI